MTTKVTDLNDYQEQALTTAVYRDNIDTEIDRISYAIFGLIGESGELANAWKKYHRGDISLDDVIDKLHGEAGDVLWYIAVLADELGFELEDVAQANLAKLADRKERDVLKGSGDNR